jgi:hypothetical protein
MFDNSPVSCTFALLGMIFLTGRPGGTGNHAQGLGGYPIAGRRAAPLSTLPAGSSCVSHLNHELRHRLNERPPAVDRLH